MNKEKEITGIWEVIGAIEAVISSAAPEKRQALADTIKAYSEDFPEDFFWAVGEQAPTMLNKIMTAIDAASLPEQKSRPRLRLVDCKPEGSA